MKVVYRNDNDGVAVLMKKDSKIITINQKNLDGVDGFDSFVTTKKQLEEILESIREGEK